MAKLTDAQCQETVDAVHLHGGVTQAAAALRVNRETLNARNRTAVNRGFKPQGQSAKDRELVGLKDRVNALTAELKAVHRDALTEDRIRDEIFGLSRQPITVPPKWVLEASKAATSGPGVPSVLWSDWHWGEVVQPAQVAGINKFDLDIAHARAKMLVSRTIDLCFNHMVKPNYPGIVINLGGDMVSGDIHEELAESNEVKSMPTVLDITTRLIWMLEQMADRFERVFVPCVAGNHGRTTKKSPFKNRSFTNFDWQIYHLLQMHFKAKGDKRLVFMIPDGADAPYTVYNHRYLLTHGDNLGVKGGDGIIGALGPILRGSFKISNANSSIGQPFDTLLMGHWHQYIPLRRVIVNGTLKGYDEYAMLALRAGPEDPCQALWFTHPKRGITAHWAVKLTDDKATWQEPLDWVSFRQQQQTNGGARLDV